MKAVILLACVLLVSATDASGQVSKLNPFGGTIKEKYLSADSKAIVEVEFLKEDSAELAVPVTEVKDLIMVVNTVSERISEDNTKVHIVNKQATLIPPDDPNAISRSFQVEIANSGTANLTSNPIRLPKNWESFTYRISGKFGGDTRSTALLEMQKPTSLEVRKLRVNVGDPIWLRDPQTGTPIKEILVPITSLSASLAADVSLHQGTTDAKTENPEMLSKGKPNIIKFNVSNFGIAQPITIGVKPADLEGLVLLLEGKNCSTSQNEPVCTWTPAFKEVFQINQTDSDLKDLKITSVEKDKAIKIRMTTSAKGAIKAKLDGNPAVPLSGGGNSFQLVLNSATLQAMKDGEHTLEFEGESFQDVKLSEKPFKFQKVTKPLLASYPTFSLENEKLKLTYELSGDLAASKPELTYREGGGTAGTFGQMLCNKEANGNLKCGTEMTVSFASIKSEDKKKAQIPVKLEILAQTKGDTGFKPVEGGTLGFDLLNQAALKTILDEIRANHKVNGDNGTAKARIAKEVLRVAETDASVEETFNQYIKGKDESRKKFFQILIGIGNFALKGFGVPITIPTNLVG